MYIIATQGEGKEQKECVFAWTVLLRNVTLARIPKGHHGWTPAKKQGSNLCACSNLNEPELQHISKQVTNPPLDGDPQSGIVDWRSSYALSFLFLYTATKYKSTDAIYTTNRPVRNYWDSERYPGAEPLRCAQKAQSELVAYVLVFLSFINNQQTWNSIIC